MKQRAKSIVIFLVGLCGGLTIGGIVGAFLSYFLLLTDPTSEYDHQALLASQQMAVWTKADVEQLWAEARDVWERYRDTSAFLSREDTPELLQNNEWKIRAFPDGLSGFCGGSSFGITGASISILYEDPNLDDEARLGTPVGISCFGGSFRGFYTPDTKEWSSKPMPPTATREESLGQVR